MIWYEVKESEFEKILASTPDGIRHIDFARIWILNKSWANFYTIAKYGSKQLGVSAARLFNSAFRSSVDRVRLSRFDV